jgi:TatD DNase family protein
MAIGTGDGPPELDAGLRIAEDDDRMLATVGVHPHDAAKVTEETYRTLAELAGRPKCAAWGEIGLDYHYDFSPRETQRAIFARQLELAGEAGLPIVIHTREAWAETVELIEQYWRGTRGGVFHCFSGNPREAEEALRLGFHVSFSGIITFPRSTEIQEAARLIPAERLLIETDAPYLAPVPYRAKRNEPAYVVETAKRLAELRASTVEEIARQTTANWLQLMRVETFISGGNTPLDPKRYA